LAYWPVISTLPRQIERFVVRLLGDRLDIESIARGKLLSFSVGSGHR